MKALPEVGALWAIPDLRYGFLVDITEGRAPWHTTWRSIAIRVDENPCIKFTAPGKINICTPAQLAKLLLIAFGKFCKTIGLLGW